MEGMSGVPSTTTSPDRPPKMSGLERVRGHGVPMDPTFPVSDWVYGSAIGPAMGCVRARQSVCDQHRQTHEEGHTHALTPCGIMWRS